MTKKEAAQLLSVLAQGLDPFTGEVLPPDHLLQDEVIAQALVMATEALGGSKDDDDSRWVRANGKLNAGRPWTEEDNARLAALMAAGTPMGEIALTLQRRPRGLAKQIRLLGLDGSTPVKSGQSWTTADDEELRHLHQLRWPEDQLAAHFQRTPYAIHCRLIRLGLIPNDIA